MTQATMEKPRPVPPRERLVQTAAREFYEEGYRAVGIDRIIKDAGIAKATFYAHFASKDDLYVEVLKRTSEGSLGFMRTFSESRADPLDRLLGPIDFLLHWLGEHGFRGCTFINMAAEVPDETAEARTIGALHYAQLQDMIAGFGRDLAAHDPGRFAHLADDGFAGQYMVIFAGAIALSTVRKSAGPIHAARDLILKLVRCA